MVHSKETDSIIQRMVRKHKRYLASRHIVCENLRRLHGCWLLKRFIWRDGGKKVEDRYGFNKSFELRAHGEYSTYCKLRMRGLIHSFREYSGEYLASLTDIDVLARLIGELANPSYFKSSLYDPGGSRYRLIRLDEAGEIIWQDVAENDAYAICFPEHWRTSTVVDLARYIKENAAWDRYPILGDALVDAGCDDEKMLYWLRQAPATPLCYLYYLDYILAKQI